MKQNILIIGAGGVAHVAAHKCAQNNDILGDICIASRKQYKCDALIESIKRKKNIKDPGKRLFSRQIDALDSAAVVNLIKDTASQIVINLATPYVNKYVLEACIQAGAAYMDTALYEEQHEPCPTPPWYAHYEWTKKDACTKSGITAIVGVGFDPGVVNAYAALALKHHFDMIDTIDMMDVNVGCHGKYFATNFDPEINLREFIKAVSWIDRKWVTDDIHAVKAQYDFPVVGSQTLYLTGHDEVHSLAKNMDVNTVRFWMGFSDHYLNVFKVLSRLGMTSIKPVTTSEGIEVVPLKVLKAVLPNPQSLAPNYTGKTCIGDLLSGKKDGLDKQIFIYNICDHATCYQEVESQAISYTAGVPPVAAALLIAQGTWDVKTLVNVEELDPDPFISLLDTLGLPTHIRETNVPLLQEQKNSCQTNPRML